MKPMNISHHPQLFLDDALIAQSSGLSRRPHQPVRHEANPLIVQDRPWEKRSIGYCSVWLDPQAQRFRCLYLANEYQSKDEAPDVPEGPRTAKYCMCYAESDDGVQWRKPPVGPWPYAGHHEHNIVIAGGHGFCVLPTPDDPDPQKRYHGLGGDIIGCSPDGIHWRTMPFDAAGKNDTCSTIIRWQDRYLAFVRIQVRDPNWSGVMRGVALCTSDDFEHWTDKETIFTTDAEDGYPWTQPYGLCVSVYGDLLIGMLPMLHLDREEGNNMLGDMDVQLMVSRDGRRWDRAADRACWLDSEPPRPPQNRSWDARLYPSTTLVKRNDRIHIYYTGSNLRHGEGRIDPTGPWRHGIGLATLPADRFVGLRPSDPGREGILQTPMLKLANGRLTANAQIGNESELRVAVLDERGQPVEGFDQDQCRLIRHDSLRYRVVWGREPSMRELSDLRPGVPAALRFALSGGELFAFQVVRF